MKAIAKDDPETRRLVTPRPGDEINLAEYAATSWRYRWVILAAVVLAGAVTYLVNRQMTPTYEATVRLLATESKVMDEVTTRAIVSVERFRELLVSPSLVAGLLQEFNLSAAPHNLTPQRFLDSNLEVTEIPDTGILQASMRLTDPGTLVKLANQYATKAVQLAEELNLNETVYARNQIKVQADQAKARLLEAQTQLEQFRRKTQLELLRKDVESLLEHRSDVVALQVEIGMERAQLRQAEIELSRQERVRDVRSSLESLPEAPAALSGDSRASQPVGRPPATSPVWPKPLTPGEIAATKPRAPGSVAAGQPPPPLRVSPKGTVTLPEAAVAPEPRRDRPAPERSPDLPVRGELTDPYVNPVYEVLARDVAQSRARLAGLEGRRQQLVSELKLAAPSSAKLNALYAAETQLAHLVGEYEVAQAAYMNASTKYEEARLQITVRSPRLQILDSALPPERPVAPNIPRNVAAAVMLALTISVIAVIMVDSSRQRRA